MAVVACVLTFDDIKLNRVYATLPGCRVSYATDAGWIEIAAELEAGTLLVLDPSFQLPEKSLAFASLDRAWFNPVEAVKTSQYRCLRYKIALIWLREWPW